MKSSSVWNRKVQLGFGAAILTLLGAGVISYRALVVSNQSLGWVRHTDQVLEELQEALCARQDIESSSRGFILTGDNSFIISFKVNISGDKTELIFERLFQVSDPAVAGRNGLGLGLYICKELVSRQGGKIWATSVRGEGSTFSITAPTFSLPNLLAPAFRKDNYEEI